MLTNLLFALIACGILLIFWEDIFRLLQLFRSNWKVYPPLLLQSLRETIFRKQSLKAKIELLNKGRKENFIVQSYNTMSQTLAATGEGSKEKQMRMISLICAALGAFFALYLRSYALVPILTVGCGLIPMWLIKFKLFWYNMRMQNELSVALSMVTNSFVRSENIVTSINENLPDINEPLKSIFQRFVFSCKGVNPDIVANLRGLKAKVDNKTFSLWCETMIDCQRDINSKANLNAVIDQFSNDKEVYNLLATEVSKPLKYYLILVGITVFAFPVSKLLASSLQMQQMTGLLSETLIGQSIVAGYVLSILYGLNVAITLSTSME